MNQIAVHLIVIYKSYHNHCHFTMDKKKRRVRSTRQCSITSQSETSTEVGERLSYSLLLLSVYHIGIAMSTPN